MTTPSSKEEVHPEAEVDEIEDENENDIDSGPNLLIPPQNFAMVAKGVYRAGYPNPKNFPFLKKLGLKSIM